jgi:hypothetical protein
VCVDRSRGCVLVSCHPAGYCFCLLLWSSSSWPVWSHNDELEFPPSEKKQSSQSAVISSACSIVFNKWARCSSGVLRVKQDGCCPGIIPGSLILKLSAWVSDCWGCCSGACCCCDGACLLAMVMVKESARKLFDIEKVVVFGLYPWFVWTDRANLRLVAMVSPNLWNNCSSSDWFASPSGFCSWGILCIQTKVEVT